MFDLSINEIRRVILCRFDEEMTADDFAALDEIGRSRKEIALYDCIFDVSRVRRLDLPTGFAAERGEIPQAFKDRARVYVVQSPEVRDLVQRYADSQAAKGWRPPVIVGSFAKACTHLGVTAADFR
ncbi:MAG: hypothetical protein JSR47_09075 [Proteobacteria bacterium]|nr:hypothetical protein [Pseudomonadota bacterium]